MGKGIFYFVVKRQLHLRKTGSLYSTEIPISVGDFLEKIRIHLIIF